MRFARRKTGVPDELFAAVGGRPDVLATARTPEGDVYAFRQLIAVPVPTGWQLIGWHLIVEGGFRPETQELWWRLLDGDSGSVRLVAPDPMPEVFRERVTASIVMQQRVQTPAGKEAVIAARRDLASDEVSWHVTAVGATDLSDADTRAYLAELTQELRREFVD